MVALPSGAVTIRHSGALGRARWANRATTLGQSGHVGRDSAEVSAGESASECGQHYMPVSARETGI